MTEATRVWGANDRDDSYLYRGTRLAAAQEWAGSTQAQLNAQEQAFFTASQRREKKQKRQQQLFRLGVLGVLLFIIGVLLVAVRLVQKQAAETERQQQIALAQLVAALSGTVLEQNNDTELATLLAIEGARLHWDASGSVDWLVDNALRSFFGHPNLFQ